MPPAALPGAARRVASAGGCSRPAAYIPRQSRERGPLRFSVKAKPLRGAFGSLDPAPTLNTPPNAPKRAVVAFSHPPPTLPLPMPTKRRYGPFSALLVERGSRVAGAAGAARSAARTRAAPERAAGPALDALGTTHAPGRGEGKKGRRPVCPTPLTTEGDSFPPEGGRRGETQGEAAQAVGRRGAHCGPRWGPRYAGRGAAPVGRGGTPQGCPVPRTRDLFLYINLSF